MCIVIAGIILINYSKWIYQRDHTSINDAETHILSGSLLALVAAFCYALSNVLQEKISIKETGYPWSTLGAMGIGGSALSLVVTQFTLYGIRDRDELIYNPSSAKYWVIGYICSMILMYSCVPLYLQRWGAIRFNFSMLTADMYVFLYHFANPVSNNDQLLDSFYLLGFVSVLTGLFIFNLRQPQERILDR